MSLRGHFLNTANAAQFRAYANQLEVFIHTGAAQDYTEAALSASVAAFQATGQSETLRRLAANPHVFGIVAVGAAFQRAFDQAVVKTSGFYDADGRHSIAQPGTPMNLWWDDYLHSSTYGSYLDALVQFGTITGRDPLTLGAGETAARDLGITPAQAQTLQRIASEQLVAASGAMPASCNP